MRRIIVLCILMMFSFVLCSAEDKDTGLNINDYTFKYIKDRDAVNPSYLLTTAQEWKLGYPSDSTMITALCTDSESKYYSLYRDSNNEEWMHFALWGGEKGTSKNSTHPRSELRHCAKGGDWEFTGKKTFSWTMNAACTNPDAYFWTGQIHGESTTPPLMIRVQSDGLYLELKNPETKRPVSKTKLCDYQYGADVSVKLCLDGLRLNVYINDELKADTVLCNSKKNYFKLGLYSSSTKDKYTDVFYEVFIKDVKVEME